MRESRTLRWLRETEKIERHPKLGRMFSIPRPHMVCRDGFSMSVQAAPGLYCNLFHEPMSPMVLGRQWSWEPGPVPYDTAEVHCVEPWEPMLDEYGDPENPCGYVPLAVIDAIIEKHGGLECDPLPTMRTPTGRRKMDL